MLKPQKLHYEDVRNKFSLVVVVVTVVVVIVVVVTVVVDSGGRDVIKIVLAVVVVAALPTPAPEKYECPGNLLDYAALKVSGNTLSLAGKRSGYDGSILTTRNTNIVPET